MMGCSRQLALSCRTIAWAAVLGVAGNLAAPGKAVWSQETEQERAARLEKLAPEQKEDLLRKKQRFDALSKEEQQRLRDLHVSITGDAHARELEEIAKRYNQWLATLTSPQRAALLTIQDPKERIARIKELMEQQEEQRFREFLPNLSAEDREAVFRWLATFVGRHEEDIRKNMPPEIRERLAAAPDEEARRRQLIMSWNWQFRRREPTVAQPSTEEFEQLLKSLSAETRHSIEQTVTATDAKVAAEQRQARIAELVRAATISRLVPQVSRDELLKYYTAMKADDPRRERLEPLEGEALYRELMRMYVNERYGSGPPGSRGSGPPGERRDGKGFPGKRPPGPPGGGPGFQPPDKGGKP
jgi:hypothetical protein